MNARFVRALLASGLLLACTLGSVTLAASQGDRDQTLYGLGVLVGRTLTDFNLSEEELGKVEGGIRDVVLGNELKVDERSVRPQVQALRDERAGAAAEAEKKASAAFLAKAAAAPGAEKTDSGLIFTVVEAGNGPSPKATDTVRVHYTGTLRDGTVFDSSRERGPAEFPLNGVIPCWTEGVALMKVGGRSTLVCPADIAYGDRGSQGRIPGGAALSFDVELLEIVVQ